MDDMKILKRAWSILWNYRILWVFGFLLALTMGGGSYSRIGSNSGYQYQQNQDWQSTDPRNWLDQSLPGMDTMSRDLERAFRAVTSGMPMTEAIKIAIGIAIAFVVILFVISIGLTFLRYMTENSLIRLVDEHETSDTRHSLREGIRMGWNKSAWHLFLIDLLLFSLPAFLLILLVGLAGFGVYATISAATTQSLGFASMAALAGLIFFASMLFVLYFTVIAILRHFIARACVLGQAGVGASIKAGFAQVKENWKAVGRFWLIMIGLGIAWGVASLVLLIALIPFFLVSVLAGVLIASLPGLLAGGISMLFLGEFWPLVVGLLFGLPFFIPIAASPALFVEGMAHVFRSTCWTLVYRELKTLPVKPVVPEELPSPA